MNPRKAITLAVALIAVFVTLAATRFLHYNGTAVAQTTADTLALNGIVIHYTPIGIALGQTARLNFANVGKLHGIGDPNDDIVINWRLLDADGAVIAQADHPLTLPSGKMMSVEVNRDTLSRTDPRIEILAEVDILTPANPGKLLRQSLEVFDNASGRTTVFQPGLVEPPDPD
jgi:hypothetical protein